MKHRQYRDLMARKPVENIRSIYPVAAGTAAGRAEPEKQENDAGKAEKQDRAHEKSAERRNRRL